MKRAWGAAARALGVTLAAATGCGGGRDVVPETHDVRGATATLGPEGYVYVAKRPHGLVALAEARGLEQGLVNQAVDHLADELDACAARLLAEGKLAEEGAGRVVASIGDDGAVRGLNVKAAPGTGVAANLLVCVVGPLRQLAFPQGGDGGARGLAIEAVWGRAPH